MGIMHGGVYAAIAESLASMGTGRAVLPIGKVPLGHVEQHELSSSGERRLGPRRGRGDSPGPDELGLERRDARRRGAALCARVTRSRLRSAITVRSDDKVKVGFFSFTEITDPDEHRSLQRVAQLDHMPEQFPFDGIAYGQRWVSTPACRAART